MKGATLSLLLTYVSGKPEINPPFLHAGNSEDSIQCISRSYRTRQHVYALLISQLLTAAVRPALLHSLTDYSLRIRR